MWGIKKDFAQINLSCHISQGLSLISVKFQIHNIKMYTKLILVLIKLTYSFCFSNTKQKSNTEPLAAGQSFVFTKQLNALSSKKNYKAPH